MSETYTEAGLRRKNLTELGEIASDYKIAPTQGDKASLIAAILAAQDTDDVADDDGLVVIDDMDEAALRELANELELDVITGENDPTREELIEAIKASQSFGDDPDAIAEQEMKAELAERLDAMTRNEVASYAWEHYGIEDPQHIAVSKEQFIEKILENFDPAIDRLDDADSEPEPDVPEGLVLLVGLTAPNRMALWEQHRDHPGGEISLRGGQRAAAALTPGVQRAVRENRVRIVDGK